MPPKKSVKSSTVPSVLVPTAAPTNPDGEEDEMPGALVDPAARMAVGVLAGDTLGGSKPRMNLKPIEGHERTVKGPDEPTQFEKHEGTVKGPDEPTVTNSDSL